MKLVSITSTQRFVTLCSARRYHHFTLRHATTSSLHPLPPPPPWGRAPVRLLLVHDSVALSTVTRLRVCRRRTLGVAHRHHWRAQPDGPVGPWQPRYKALRVDRRVGGRSREDAMRHAHLDDAQDARRDLAFFRAHCNAQDARRRNPAFVRARRPGSTSKHSADVSRTKKIGIRQRGRREQ